MKLSKEEFVERFKRDKAEKSCNEYFGREAAINFRIDGRNKKFRRNYRGRIC